ncbi:hypothetical protein HOY80DRAFT_686365 [Tuber brumale]|nr:hypothetical protein HOY80DRAFT_686365 [Tuber brumale]
MPQPVHLISKTLDPLFALLIGTTAAAIRIRREEAEAGRSGGEAWGLFTRYGMIRHVGGLESTLPRDGVMMVLMMMMSVVTGRVGWWMRLSCCMVPVLVPAPCTGGDGMSQGWVDVMGDSIITSQVNVDYKWQVQTQS